MIQQMIREEQHSARALYIPEQDLDAQATTLAALLAVRRRRPRLWHLALGPLAAGGHTLVARPARQRGPARWFLAVLAGYRTAVVYAKLWERSRAEGW